jgi:glycosyltransferase involved in cell wall biosynthesis
LIHAHGRFLNAGVLAEEIFSRHGIKYIYTEHSTFYQRGIAPVEAKPVLRRVLQNAAAYTFVSIALLKKVEDFLGEKLEHAQIIRNTLDQLFESPMNRGLADGNKPFIVCIGSLDEKKGIDVLIRAYRDAFKSDRPTLYICGEGRMRESLTDLIISSGLKDDVFLLGNQSKKEIVSLLDNCAFFVLPSIVETFGVVVIEALSRGCPVIATRSGGPEFILNETNGILTEPGDVEGLTRALKEMLDLFPDFDRQKIREDAIGRFGSKAFIEEISRIYNKVLQ